MSDFPYLTQVIIIADTAHADEESIVFINTLPIAARSNPLSEVTTEPPLKPNQLTHSINAPRAAKGIF